MSSADDNWSCISILYFALGCNLKACIVDDITNQPVQYNTIIKVSIDMITLSCKHVKHTKKYPCEQMQYVACGCRLQ